MIHFPSKHTGNNSDSNTSTTHHLKPNTQHLTTPARLIAATVILLAGCASDREIPSVSSGVSRQVYLMGTACTLTSFAVPRSQALGELDALIRLLQETESQLSTWQEGSPLSHFNRQPVGMPYPLSPDLCRLFQTLLRWHTETVGTFDPAVGRLIEAWGLRAEGRIPDPAELSLALDNSGMRGLLFDPGACVITRRSSVSIDSGAFGKGEALDRLADLSRRRKFAPWIVDLGGQVSVFGNPPGENGWAVDLASPRARRRARLAVRIASGSLATSGGSERDLIQEGRRIGHILDPRSGQPAVYTGTVVVWHEAGLIADILSTALFVMGPAAGLSWAEDRGLAVCFLSPEGEARTSRAFRDLLVSSNRLLNFGYQHPGNKLG